MAYAAAVDSRTGSGASSLTTLSETAKRAAQTNSIGARLWGWTGGNGIALWNAARRAIGGAIRDVYFFPLIKFASSVRAQMKIEQTFFSDFWNVDKPLDPNFKEHRRIREHFDWMEQPITVRLDDTTLVTVNCRIIESKGSSHRKDCYNFVHFPGNVTTLNNNIAGIYPYLASYLEERDENGELPPGRFITMTPYDIECSDGRQGKKVFLPETMEESGLVFARALGQLKLQYGDIHQVVAHSLGSILFTAALKNMKGGLADVLPKNLVLERGPSSIYEASKKYWCGRVIHLFAKGTGWSQDTAREIAEFYKQRKPKKEEFSLLVTGVVQDHHFAGKANLCNSSEIRDLQKRGELDMLVFNPPQQVVHQDAHHNWMSHSLHQGYLCPESSKEVMGEGENLARLIIRRSLCHMATHLQMVS